MSDTKRTVVDVECDTPRDYRAVRHLCAAYPHRAELVQDGSIRVHDAAWFARLLASCNGRVIAERRDPDLPQVDYVQMLLEL